MVMKNNKRNFIKLFSVSLFLVFVTVLLASCQKDDKKYSIMTPAGAPAFSQLYLEKNSDKYDVTTISGPDNIPSHFNEGEFDVILAPTNIGMKLYNIAKEQNKNFAYELAANVVFGNNYIVSKENLALEDLAGKKIYAYGKNATPGITLRYILEKNNIVPESIEYLPGGIDAQNKFLQDTDIIALIPEPALSGAEAQLSKRGITINRISVLDEYNKANNTTEGFPQASLFVKKTLKDSEKDAILKDIKKSIEKLNSDPEGSADIANNLGYQQPKAVIVNAIPHMNIKFVSGNDCKLAVENYFNIIIEVNPNLIGTTLPDANFYYIKK